MDERKEQWYNNQQIFEMVQAQKEEMNKLTLELKLTTAEMARTREIVARYNGLREELENCKDQIDALRNQAIGRYSVGDAVIRWGGWLVAVGTLILSVMRR